MKELTPYQEQLVNDIITMPPGSLKVEAYQQKIIEAYSFLFDGEICNNCQGDITNAYYRIRNFIVKPKPMTTKITNNSRFVLNDGALVIDPQDGEMYSNANLTDEVAFRVLSKYPGAAKRFKTIPEGVNIAQEPTPEVVKEAEKLSAIDYVNDPARTREELAAVCLENGMDEKAVKKFSTEKMRKELLKKIQ